MVVFLDVTKDQATKLMNFGFALLEPKTYYEVLRMKGSCTAVLFRSGKLLLQGKQEPVDAIAAQLCGMGLIKQRSNFLHTTGTIIGSDEALKGDSFGGLVVAGVRADDIDRENLRLLGVMDSKKLTDDHIRALVTKIIAIVPSKVISLLPEEYNRERLTPLLNRLHRRVGTDLKTPESIHIVDQYPGCTVGRHMTKAESKYIEVAAASILARAEALAQIDRLSRDLGYTVPKGSTHVADALKYLKKSGKDPHKFVKLHFKNVQAALS